MATISEIAGVVSGAIVYGNADAEITGITHDSRKVRAGFIFAALAGASTDGKQFIESAKKNGAVCVLTDKKIETSMSQIVVSLPRKVLGKIAAACYLNPSDKLNLVGITGTNGKTTITYLIEAALAAAEKKTGVMGTVEYRCGTKKWNANHTTPEATVVQSITREIVEEGASHLIMEVSSHGLALDRLVGCQFNVVAFTNLTQDHLDFHENMEKYAAAKMLLFTEAIKDTDYTKVVLNLDDAFSKDILKKLDRPAITVSCDLNSDADIKPISTPSFDIGGISTRIQTPIGDYNLFSPLLGEHNLSNLLVAIGVCVSLNADIEKVIHGFKNFSSVPGRLEQVPSNGDFAVLVDYAHTPDALNHALLALSSLANGRLLCVFGCGGDRDNSKRPLMGEAVGANASVAIVTSDNPRTENPDKIIEMIIPGIKLSGKPELLVDDDIKNSKSGYVVVVDRTQAISLAIGAAKKGDVVLIAGKGHEDYQIVGTKKIHFDDREQAAKEIAVVEKSDVGRC